MTHLFAVGPFAFALAITAACSSKLGPQVPPGPSTDNDTGGGYVGGTGGATSGGTAGTGATAYLTTRDGSLKDSAGGSVALAGVTWFGFENGSGTLQGLNQGTDSLNGDFATLVYRLQALGFNTVRLPFSFADLNTLTPTPLARSCTMVSAATVQQGSLPPNTNAGTTVFPAQIAPTLPTPGQCNEAIPSDTMLRRFTWVVQYLAQNHFYVVVTNRAATDGSAVHDSSTWVQNWTSLVTTLTADPNTAGRVIVDLLDEPDSANLTWTTLAPLYTNAMDSIFRVAPTILVLLQGAGQQSFGSAPGDGFVTDPATVASDSLSDPNPFFRSLMQKSYLAQVALAPHVMPPSVSGRAGDTATVLWSRLSKSFGYLNRTGYCVNASCKRMAVILGSIGSNFLASTDQTMMGDLARYMTLQSAAADGLHDALTSWIWLAYNVNNPQTGGLVDSTWRAMDWSKIAYLTGTVPQWTYSLGLSPWYVQ